ncbi:DUF6602 domain-containing protein [Flavobacterium sp. S87F.05.LMB.W.Kidney.N]|uniref:DUF6602 domain-containing protein n=1 Tax=Flavobacterium sp. S87F.05.LMB.W.Kidney.N TaxID=1278758 RepID=UPI001065E5D3|nr:DUF6602 domain-containing protein [Flavobacterium sp. S87F.05.LMB.W.Kidney.N]TDX09725.1 hypothetical protein EDB96_3312 [Flavobacterium sp. S87F.05.LMB.W.Kidney.N]
MGNPAFEALLIEHFEKFKLSFNETTVKLFVNEQGQLIHPGEYGAYRENICKDFLRLLIPQNLDINKGFVITSLEKVSTECDIIIYDRENTPLLQSNELQRFYTVETVCSVGEIKSTLSKSDFKLAINKLARVKKLRDDIQYPSILKRDIEKKIPYNPVNIGYDGIFTFLICKKLNFNIDNLPNEIDSLYDSDILHYQKHNLILSIDDGVLLYYFDDINLGHKKTLYYPFFSNTNLKHRFVFPYQNKYAHLKTFSSYFFAGVSSATILFPDMVNYMGSVEGGRQMDMR